MWCSACNTVVKSCRKNGKGLSECEHIEKLQYRFVGFIHGTKRRIVRSLGKDFNSAVKQVVILRQQLAEGNIGELVVPKDNSDNATTPKQQNANTQTKPVLLVHIFAKYLASLRGQGVANHLKLERSAPHVRDVKNCFRQFCEAIEGAGFPIRNFRLVEISDEAVGAFHDALIKKGYSNSSYNRFFSHLMTFASYCEREDFGNVKRFFERVPRKTVTPRPEIITKEEFEKTLSVISYENGFQYGVGKGNETRNHFREYLIPSFKYALITGRRLEEIITSRFSDVCMDESGRPLYITFTDHKVSRIMHLASGEERKLHSPVTKEISAFLIEQGFEQKKNTDDFILASQILHNRIASMRQAISRGFSHFWNVAFPEAKNQRSLKHLRKTFITALAAQGKNVREVSGHSSDQILKSYIDEKQVALANSLKDFSVFGDQAKMKSERKNLRSYHAPEKSIGHDPP